MIATKATQILSSVSAFIEKVGKSAANIKIVEAAVPNIMDFLSGLATPFDEVKAAMNDIGITASEGFEQMASDIADSIYKMEPLAQSLGYWFDETYNIIQEKDWSGLRSQISTGLTNTWDGIVEFFEDEERFEDAGKFAANLINGIGDFLSDMTVDDWRTIYDSIAVGLQTFFEELDYEAIFSGLANAMLSLGYSLVEWIYEGVKSWIQAGEKEELRLPAVDWRYS